ncbi:hypothetical protein [Massilia brevitalea]|uniref:hypothetical protein n=1 Tax=Massilia brevitalea TaxID=442526 RepID=UPI002739F0FB|nr:hypothetical protein [Massilia brevitalea]
MKQGRPFVAFSLEPSDDALHITLLSGPRVLRNEVVEQTFTDLPSLSLHGLDGGAAIIGKFVLAVLQREYPEKFKKYPNLIIKVGRGPTEEDLKAMEERLGLDASDEGG